MLETASKRPQRRRADRSSASNPIDTRQDERDLSLSSPRAVDPPPESRMNRIAHRAHEIYEARGEHGRALEDWLQAEREIDAELSRERGT
jgi:hypothetical protein